MAAREHRETHKIEQTRKIVPFVTRKTPSTQRVSKLVLMSTYLIWIFGSKLIEQTSATQWVLETRLTVGLLPLKKHLDHTFTVFKNVQLRLVL